MPGVTVLLAGVNPEDIFPFLLGALLLATPLVVILTKHQQKMAEIFRGRTGDSGSQPTDQEMRILHELSTLRQMVAQQSIAIDNLSRTLPPVPDREEPLRDRLR